MSKQATENTPLLRDKKDPTPLPWGEVLLIALIVFGKAFSYVLVYPFLPFMTHDFFPHFHPRELGYKAGYLGSAFFVGVLCSSYVWGILADRVGRRPVLIFGSLMIFLCVIAFGFSSSFTWALWSRFLWGAGSGNIGVAKTYLSEVLDDSNSARGFSVIGVMFALGRLSAPIAAGFLSKPADKYQLFDTSLFRAYPYLLPCLVAAGVAFIGFVGSILWLRETLHTKPEKLDEGQDQVDAMEANDNPSAFNHYNVFLSCLLYAMLAFIAIIWTDTFPLWILNAPEDGGFSFQTNDIGIVYSICAPFEMINLLIIYPIVAEKISLITCLRYSFLGMACMLFIIPFANMTTGYPTWVQWTSLCACSVLLTGSIDYCFNNVFMLVNNSAPKRDRARVNGAGAQLAAAGRSVAPSLASILFAWSETNGKEFPLNFHFVFILASALAFSCVTITTLLPMSLNRSPVEN